MNRKLKTLFKDIIIFAIGNLGSKIISFFLVPVYTNFLTTAQYGTADLVISFSNLLYPILGLSIEKAVFRFGMKSTAYEKDVVSNALLVFSCSSMVTLVITPVFSLYGAISEWRWYLSIYVILCIFNEIQRSTLKIKGKNKQYAFIGIVHTLILAVSNIILIVCMKLGVKGYLLSNIMASLIIAIIYMFSLKIYKDILPLHINIGLLIEMIKYSFPLIFSGIAWWILHSSDKIMIELMIGPAVLGLYTAATKIPSLINLITGIFAQAWSLSSIREFETEKESNLYAKVFDALCFVIFGVGILLISVVKPFMNAYMGESFRTAWVLTPFLIFASVYYSIFSFVGVLYATVEKSINDMWSSLACAGLNIIVNFIAIKAVGVFGAVIGTVVAYFIFSIIRIVNVRKYILFQINTKLFVLYTILFFAEALSITKNRYVIQSSIIIVCAFMLISYKNIFFVINRIRKH